MCSWTSGEKSGLEMKYWMRSWWKCEERRERWARVSTRKMSVLAAEQEPTKIEKEGVLEEREAQVKGEPKEKECKQCHRIADVK